jgi:hypothetical protein
VTRQGWRLFLDGFDNVATGGQVADIRRKVLAVPSHNPCESKAFSPF